MIEKKNPTHFIFFSRYLHPWLFACLFILILSFVHLYLWFAMLIIIYQCKKSNNFICSNNFTGILNAYLELLYRQTHNAG